MNKKALYIFEYNKIIDRLSACATCEPGRNLCKALMPDTDYSVIVRNQQETTAAESRIFKRGSLSFSGVTDILPQIKSMAIGSSLGIAELISISSLLKVAAAAVKYSGDGDSDAPDGDALASYFSSITTLPEVRSEIDRCLISEDEIADDASPELKDIRRRIKNCGERIRSELSKLLNGSDRTYLQEAVITTRDGRYCVPVKQEYKSQIPGMIHDQSKAGSTYFIEPMSVVRLNNEIRELEIAESEEIARILATLTAMAGNYTAELETDYNMLSYLDFVFAKGKLSINMKASEPIINTDGIINLKKARHPLIDDKRVVPVDIYLGEKYRQLIITGPNTGGKTVTLKTVGLFSMMGQAGLHIPVSDNSAITIFNKIFADIGDEQSIEQSLSTFSSHMKNIISILKDADESSLVLFDELCAGTDPTEGAALAIAILSRLSQKGATAVATTHYSELKVYALSTPGVENACCEFDVASLAPTYRLLIGIPGKSNAFAISRKLGLDNDIIEQAKSTLASEDRTFEDVITDLERKRVNIEKQQIEIIETKREIEELRNALRQKEEKLSSRTDAILEKAREQANEILADAKEVADETIRTLNKAQSEGISMAELEARRRKVKSRMDKVNKDHSISKSTPNKQYEAKDFHIGDRVKVHSLGLEGTVHTLPNAKGELTVTMGILNSTVKISDLEILEEAKETEKLKQKNTGIGRLKMSKTATISPEVNLIGLNSDEAIMKLDKYLDDAFLSHISPVRIVHGKGSGILRNAVHNYLKRQKHVKSFRLGSFGEGDYGVTIVEFKE